MKSSESSIHRRDFLKVAAAFGAITILPSYVALGKRSGQLGPNDKLNVAVIGIGNQGNGVRRALLATGHSNIVALCDVDMEGPHTHISRYQHGLTSTPPVTEEGQALPEVYPLKAKAYTDFRRMFDEMADEIDAVLIATPDHSHFAATMLAMSLGKHVFVEKPLAHTFGQCERMIRMAAKHPKLVTQMGNQGFSGGNYFQFKAWREAGIIKDVTRIDAFMVMPRRWHGWGATASEYPQQAVPSGLDWDLWHNVLDAQRPFSYKLHPQEWRSWYEFGCGAFGDWGPHILDSCHHFLDLGLPETVTAVDLRGVNQAGLVFPQASTIRFDFPARSPNLPACKVHWYDGRGNLPEVAPELDDLETNSEPGQSKRTPLELGNAGKMIYSKELTFRGGHHGDVLSILPRKKFMDMRSSLPSFPQRNSNHYANFLLACQGEEVARSPFSISGPLCQVFNLGIIAQRLGGELKFDSTRKQITNNPAANALLDPAPRPAWKAYYELWA